MTKTTVSCIRGRAVSALLWPLWFVVACGADGEASRSVAPTSHAGADDGVEVYLRRESTRCGSPASAPLVGQIRAGIEFEPEHMRALASPCGEGPSPGIEVDIDRGSVIFDFANVAAQARLPDAEFEGYVLQFARICGDPIFTSATVDLSVSSANVGDAAISTRFDRLKVNLADIVYDEDSFLKIDLAWTRVDCLADLEQ